MCCTIVLIHTFLSYFFPLLILHIILFTKVWFNLSFNPFDSRQSTDVNINVIFIVRIYSLTSLELISVYWSAETIFIWCCLATESINLIKSLALWTLDIYINAYLKQWSVKIFKYLLGHFLPPKPPTESMVIISKGFVAGPTFCLL